MIYSARVLEIHSNYCSCEADTMEQAGQKFLNGQTSDCLGAEYVSTAAIVDQQENPNHDVELQDYDNPQEAEEIVADALEVKLTTATMNRLYNRFTSALERVQALEDAIDNDEDNAYPFLVNNNWHGLRAFIAGMKDDLKGDNDEDFSEAYKMRKSIRNWIGEDQPED